MRWEPILDGELAERAWASVHAIADDLATASHPPCDLALCWSYLAPALGDDRSAEREDVAMAGLVAAITRGSSTLGLYEGVVNVAWTAAHTADGVDDFLVEVDALLINVLRGTKRWTGVYDLISGLVGFGVYFLERDHTEGLGLVVDQLISCADRGDAGANWYTRAEHLPPIQRTQFPDGYINCGIAHGVPGVIALLSRIAMRPDVPETVADLRDAAVRWLNAQRCTSGRFPRWVSERERDHPARTAWCYGDPGVLLALWSAARSANRPTREIEDHARECLGRDYADTGVVDAMLCHGAIGLAHISNRFYQATHDPVFRDHALTWYERTLALQVPGIGVGGFSAVRVNDSRSTAVVDFLDGSVGIALGLVAGLVPLEPQWDRLLLADLAA
jgi:hypothetical protein